LILISWLDVKNQELNRTISLYQQVTKDYQHLQDQVQSMSNTTQQADRKSVVDQATIFFVNAGPTIFGAVIYSDENNF
jgi:hypothetical protein